MNLTRDLLAAGYTNNELARLSKAGNLVHLRRGAYAQPSEQHSEAAARHRQLILATLPLAAPGSTVSHTSAAVLHGLPVWGDRLERVQLTRTLPSGGKRKGYIHLHAAPLDPTETVQIAGMAVTSLARTMVDLGRSLPFDQAVVAGDAALRAGLDPVDLEAVLCRARRRPGVAAARRAAGFLDGLSESPGESLSRVGFAAVGLPAPTLQYDVFDQAGVLVGRSDFCWEDHRTLGEFDGRVKYGRLLKKGETISDVIYEEKLREDALRDLGWQVVRWVWADLAHPEVIAERLHRAFRRASR